MTSSVIISMRFGKEVAVVKIMTRGFIAMGVACAGAH